MANLRQEMVTETVLKYWQKLGQRIFFFFFGFPVKNHIENLAKPQRLFQNSVEHLLYMDVQNIVNV